MKRILSLFLIILILSLSFSFAVRSEPEATENSSESSPVSSEESSSGETSTEDSSTDSSSGNGETSEPENSSSEETSSGEASSSSSESSSVPENTQSTSSSGSSSVSQPSSSDPQSANSSQSDDSSSASEDNSSQNTADVKIYGYTDMVIVSGSEDAFPEGTQIKIEQIKDGADYDKAVFALSDISKQFSLYRIYTTDNEASVPEGKLSAAFAIPALYDINRVAVFSLKDDGTAHSITYTLNRKKVNITATLNELGMYAVVELNEVVNIDQQLEDNSKYKKEIFVIIAVGCLLFLAAATVVVYTLNEKRKS